MIRRIIQRLFQPKEKIIRVVHRSNIIQFDCMGYPLRLCIMSDNSQLWVDTIEQENDKILRWEYEE